MERHLKCTMRNLSIWVLLAGGYALAQSIPTAHETQPSVEAALRAGFVDPPPAAMLRCYWWWLNGYTTTETITRDLTEMKAKGYAGAILVDDRSVGLPIGPAYGSPEWMKLYLCALRLAAHLGLQVSLEISDGGNVGILGDSGVGPGDALKELTYSRTVVLGGSTRDVRLRQPPMVGNYYRQIAVLAYPLRHGSPLPGEPGSGRSPILARSFKTALRQIGSDSMPSAKELFPNAPSVPGEQDVDLNGVVDLSSQTDAAGKLHWSFSPGEWEILRVGYSAARVRVTNNDGTGFAVDALSTQAFDHYWDRVVAPILSASKPYIGKSLFYLVTDSWESQGANWTDDFREEFIRLRGYDPVPYLPVVAGRIVGSRDASNAFLADLRRTVADLMTANYYDHFAQRASEYGLGTHPESGGPHGAPIDALETFRSAAFPQTEFWTASPEHRITDQDRFFVKEAESAAHIYGKRYAAAESFTRIGPPWDVSPGLNIKPTLDYALTEGLNRIFWHEFTSSPTKYGMPGDEYDADTHLSPDVTWWNQAGPMLLAMNRDQFLLQQGEPVEDLLYYYGAEVPSFARLKESDPARVLPGYNYDVTDEDALLHRMLYKNGDLHTPEGIHYRALAIPSEPWLTTADLFWIEKYVREGGTVIGLMPQMPIGNEPAGQAEQFRRVASAMWGSCLPNSADFMVRYGKGSVYCTQNAHQALADMRIRPDLSWDADGTNASFDFVHRRDGDIDIYFIRNANNAPAATSLYFRVKDRVPELWNPDTGEMVVDPLYEQKGEETVVPISFPANGSTFVLFEHSATPHAVKAECDGRQAYPSIQSGIGVYSAQSFYLSSTNTTSCTIMMSDEKSETLTFPAPADPPEFQGNWTLEFPAGWGAPAKVDMPALQSWTESSIPGVRYFSGTATYHRVLQVPAEDITDHHQVWMDLGDVREVATITVNGKQVRTLWHPPFVVRIDPSLRAGANSIEIAVTNLWPNRIIGDLQPGAVHYTKTNIHEYTKDSPLIPSGLLGPLKVYVATEEQLR
jgi:(4-O-methyl)-D-glucuronate---lignin esterase